MDQNQNPNMNVAAQSTAATGAFQQKHFRSFWPIIIIATLSAIVGGLLVWAAYNAGLDEELGALLPGSARDMAYKHKKAGLQPLTSQAGSEASDVKVYSNESFGYQFSYTKDWEISGTPDSIVLRNIKNPAQTIDFYTYPSKNSLNVEIWLKTQYSSEIDFSKKSISYYANANKVSFAQLAGTPGESSDNMASYVIHNGQVIAIIASPFSTMEANYKTILDTFKFTD